MNPESQKGMEVTTGVTALVMAIVGTAIFFIGTRGLGSNSNAGMIMFAAGGVMLFGALALGLVGIVRDDGRSAAILGLIVAIVAAIISEII